MGGQPQTVHNEAADDKFHFLCFSFSPFCCSSSSPRSIYLCCFGGDESLLWKYFLLLVSLCAAAFLKCVCVCVLTVRQ